ncbi:hypothetical protein [Psychrobacter cryohalolentis]|uniref:Lipoprotein n=1 Tax=Psychrobacter cryohalolentis (strain ATCC BAA-1226 / DSM 17306 / VKM B-2378 / K5) TaxID=335284 RepID=Q1Q9N5_PSYCK|nr:hypothetical protein [Psychrobacter cryohalolentis]ABE75618.1 hypothetical protein Pcryo_1841 [Psychrobacter cryohalolentis K5]ASE25808.1 hypothetical protein CEP87_04135 [Psychrobacter cryohalolentis]
MGLYKRLNKVVLLTVSLGLFPALYGCSQPQVDPSQQTIPTNSDQWQKTLGDTFERLPEADRKLLSRYMLRMKLSSAYESGAMPRITIKQALIQQREYERLHPNNPTGKKSPIVTSQKLETANHLNYPVALLPVKTSDSDSLNQVKLQFMLSNHGKLAIESFQGTLTMKEKRLTKNKRFNVPLTQFEPPIAPEQSGKIIIESSIEDINVMRAIKNNTGVSIEITEGKMILADGQEIEFDELLAK